MVGTIFILDKTYNTVQVLVGDKNSQRMFWDDVYTQEFDTGAETFEFSCYLNEDVVEGNFVAFYYNNQYKLFAIMDMEQEHKNGKLVANCYCETSSLALLNNYVREFSGDMNCIDFFEHILQGTNWYIGKYSTSLKNVVKAVDVTKLTSVWGLIEDYKDIFGCEINVRATYENGHITGQYIDIYAEGSLGSKTLKRFEYGRNVTGIVKKKELYDWCTGIIIDTECDVSDTIITESDGYGFTKGAGDVILDDNANRIYNAGKGHVIGVYSGNEEDPMEACINAWEELKKRSVPRFDYTVTTALTRDEYEDLHLGDTVYVIDHSYTPPLLLEARIGKLELSFTDGTQNKCVLTNYKEIKSKLLDADYVKLTGTITDVVNTFFPITSEGIADGAICEGKIDTVYFQEITADIVSAGIGAFEELYSKNLTVINADIENLIATKANITDLDAAIASIGVLQADNAIIHDLIADRATIGDLNAANANIGKLQADKANVTDLQATNANVTNLQATKADVADLEAAVADIDVLESDVAELDTLVSGNLTSDNIHSLILSADKVTVQDAFIKDAMIDNISANKITAGTLNTGKVNISSADGSMTLNGSLQQFKDNSGKVRIQLGKDAIGNFTFCLFSQDGVGILLDEEGIHAGAVPDGLIVDNMVAGNANISGSKLDINSVITSINNGATSINSSKIYLDEEGQSLQIAFNALKTKVETIEDVSIEGDLGSVMEQVTTNTSTLNIMQGQINSLISSTTITKENGEVVQLKDEFSSMQNTIGSHAVKLGSLETNVTNVTNKQANMELDINGLEGELGDVQGQVESVVSKQASMELDLEGFEVQIGNVQTQLNTTSSKQASLELDFNGFKTEVEDIEKDVDNVSSKQASLELDFNGFKTEVEDIQTDLNGLSSKQANMELTLNGFQARVEDVEQDAENISNRQANIELTLNGFNTTVQNVQSQVNTNTANISNVSNKQSSLEVTLNGFATNVQDIQKQVNTNTGNISTVNNKQANLELGIEGLRSEVRDTQAQINGTEDEIGQLTARQSSLELTMNGFQTVVSSVESGINSLSDKQTSLEAGLNGFKTEVIDSYATKTQLETTNSNVTAAQGTADTALGTANANTDNLTLLTNKQSSLEVTVNGISGKVSSLESAQKKTLTETTVQYYLSTSATSLAGGSWSNTAPVWTNDKYMWQRMKYTYTDGTVTYGTGVCISGAKGSTGATGAAGAQGPKGDKGDTGSTGAAGVGISSITEYYQVSTSSTQAPSSWVTTPPAMTSTNKYLWNYEKITYTNGATEDTSKRVIGVYGDKGATGAQGPQGAAGPQGTTGATGAKGQSLVSSTPQWYLSTSSTTQTGGSWTETMPTITAGRFMWLRYKLVWQDPSSTTYTTPVLEQIAEAIKPMQERQSAFEQDVNGVKISVTSLQTQLGGVERSVGASNLIFNPTALVNLDGWGSVNNTVIRYDATVTEYVEKPVIAPSVPSTTPIPAPVDINPQLHVIDTNSDIGLSLLLIDASGKTIFFDGGYAANQSHVVNYIKNAGVKKLTYYIITHFHSDHAESANYILDNLEVENIMYKHVDINRLQQIEFDWGTDTIYTSVNNKVKSMGIKYLDPASNIYIKLSDNSGLKVYNADCDNYDNYNNQSLQCLYTYKNNKIFFAGDGTAISDKSCQGKIGTVDIFIAGHHGDGTLGGTSEKLIDEMKPKHTVFSGDMIYHEGRTLDTLGRVKFHGSACYMNESGGNTDYKFTLTGSSVSTTGNVLNVTNLWYQRADKKWYRFGADGKLIVGKWWLDTTDSTWYMFDETGRMLQDEWYTESNYWYYLKSDGKMAKNETLTINGKNYTFNSSGVCQNP